MPQIYDMGPTALLPLRRKACWGFFRPKNPTASTGFEHANLGTKDQHATPRPPKPLIYTNNWYISYKNCAGIFRMNVYAFQYSGKRVEEHFFF